MLAQNAEAALRFLQTSGSARTRFADILEYHENDEYDAAIAATYAYSSLIVSSDQGFRLVLEKIIDNFLSGQDFVPPRIVTPDSFRDILKQQLEESK